MRITRSPTAEFICVDRNDVAGHPFRRRVPEAPPGSHVAAVLTLPLGTGANTAIFCVGRAVLLYALPYGRSDRLVTVAVIASGIPAPPEIVVEGWRARSRSFSRMSSYRDSLGVLMEGSDAEMLRGLRVSYDFFDTLDVRMALGRPFLREEDQGSTDLNAARTACSIRFGSPVVRAARR